MELVKEVGAYAGFAAVIGLGVLAALYFSQARDVKRLREWAGRLPSAPETPPRCPAPSPARAGQPRPAGPEGRCARLPARRSPPRAVRPYPATAPPPGQPGQAPAVPAKPGAPATAATGAAPAAATPPAGPAKDAAAPARPAQPTPAGGPGPATRPGRAAPAQTRVISREAAEEARRRAAERSAATSKPRPALPARHDRDRRPRRDRAHRRRDLPLRRRRRQEVGLRSKTAQNGNGGGGSDSANKTPAVDPAQVTVAVLNGTTVEGLARTIGDEIQAAGFQLGNVTNAAQQGERAESAALYAPGHKADARAVARKLKISQIEPIDAQSQTLAGDATVVVVVGLDQTQ